MRQPTTATARNQNINNLLICKYRMIMPTQTRGNFKLFIVFLLQKFGFIGSWFRSARTNWRTNNNTCVYTHVCVLFDLYVRASLRLFCFRLLEKKKQINIYLTFFEQETTEAAAAAESK